ncbi:MAG: F0F1 ATP synthase subunit B [Planctomycetota bacterium]
MYPTTFMIASEGFNPLDIGAAGSFLWTLIIFGVSLPFMWKLVFSRIAAMATERDALASKAILAAEKANQDAEQVRAEVEVHLGEAQVEAAKLMAGARERAEVRERDIVDNAKKEAEAMIASARSTILAEKDKALTAIRSEVVELSLNAASKVLGRNVGSEDDQRMVRELVGIEAPTSEGPVADGEA